MVENRFPGGNRVRALVRDNYICVYCGSDATCVDHVTPWSYSLDGSLKNLVASCNPCNLVASNFVFPTIQDKQAYILTERLRRDRGFFLPDLIPYIEKTQSLENSTSTKTERVCAFSGCNNSFLPKSSRQKFCYWGCSNDDALSKQKKPPRIPGGLTEHDVKVVVVLKNLGHNNIEIGKMFGIRNQKIGKILSKERRS